MKLVWSIKKQMRKNTKPVHYTRSESRNTELFKRKIGEIKDTVIWTYNMNDNQIPLRL